MNKFRFEERLMTPREAARVFGVNRKTLTRWVDKGKLTVVRTLGGHRRYKETEIRALWEKAQEEL